MSEDNLLEAIVENLGKADTRKLRIIYFFVKELVR